MDGSRKKGKAYSPEEREAARREIQAMTPQQREALARECWEAQLRSSKVKIDDRKVDLYTLMQEVAEEEARYNSGADVYQHKQQPPWMLKEGMSIDELRAGATKRMLLPQDQEKLGLHRFGIGICWHREPLPLLGLIGKTGERDFVYGVYADPEAVQEQLGGAWAGQEPKGVLQDERFYKHVLATAPETQLSLVAVPARDVPLGEARSAWTRTLRQRMESLPGGMTQEDEQALERLSLSFAPERLSSTGLTTGEGKLKDGSVLIFTTLGSGDLSAEAITPGVLRDQRKVYLGVYPHPRLTYALFDMVLGDKPLDDRAKSQVGNNMLYIANGFKFGPNPDNPNQLLTTNPAQPFPEPKVEPVELLPSTFSYLPASSKKLLKGIRRAKVTSHALADT